jgi:large subunit ribosomal protein L15e
MYKYQSRNWAAHEESNLLEMRQKAMQWRREYAITRIDKPTRLNKARSLGYKSKQGFVVARVRVRRGGLRKPRPSSGRRQKRMGFTRHLPEKSLKQIATERVAKKFPNLKVLNSYWLWQDGKSKYYEVILVDPKIPAIMSDPDVNRVFKAKKQ